MEWVELYESHTPYEWLVQRVLESVEPWGEDRADMRAAYNTLALLPPGDYDREPILEFLLGYLKIHQHADDDELEANPDALRMVRGD